ncbi:MAG: dipeptidase [Candidatus Kapaibacteriota bacterium]|jgi:acetylornithine deacetylase/succinyl-diaminopimelate desuccinylase-like protein
MNKDIKLVLDYIENNQDRFLEELKDFLRFPSVSTKTSHKQDIKNCADWICEQFKSMGIENVWQNEEYGNPLVLVDYKVSEDKPTLLIYGHYDVQPEDPINLWKTPPFEPDIRDGKIYARGAADDKGQVFIHIKAVESYLKAHGSLPINIKFIIEGEEESGSEAIDKYVKTHQDVLKCDAVLISDTGWFAPNYPTLSYGLRGIAVFEMTLTGPNRDLHSGMYGGAVANPLIELSKIISNLFDADGKITVPGLYDNVLPITEVEKAEFAKLPFDRKEYMEDLEIKGEGGESEYSIVEKVWMRPSLDINGLFGGYIEEGHKSIIPSIATAKISIRLVPNQTFEEINQKFKEYIESVVPASMKLSMNVHHGANPVVVDINNDYIKKAQAALTKAFNTSVGFTREGGSIPIVELFSNELHCPVVLMGFGLDSDNIHSPNENFVLSNFFGGIKAVSHYFEELAY